MTPLAARVFHGRFPHADPSGQIRVKAEHAIQANLLREIVGNPFSPARLDPAWLLWNDGIVERIARGVYDDRAYHDLPILADALLDAGCRDEVILGHCRDVDARHAPGCWVLDLLLGKE